MHSQTNNYSKTIEVKTTPSKAFSALSDNLNMWWGDISNSAFKKDGQFRVQFENGYWWDFNITEYVPSKKLAWLCTGGEPEFNKEWIGNTLHWKLETKDTKTITKIDFLHFGLTPESDCYGICAPTWDRFITEELKTYLND